MRRQVAMQKLINNEYGCLSIDPVQTSGLEQGRLQNDSHQRTSTNRLLIALSDKRRSSCRDKAYGTFTRPPIDANQPLVDRQVLKHEAARESAYECVSRFSKLWRENHLACANLGSILRHPIQCLFVYHLGENLIPSAGFAEPTKLLLDDFSERQIVAQTTRWFIR
jgi:hypothetical protein